MHIKGLKKWFILKAKKYKNLIVTGAKHWKLPKEYISFLENIKTIEDE